MAKRLTREDFIAHAQSVHGEKYDYSMIEYKNLGEKVCIVCPKHGVFWQAPRNHIYAKQGCPICGNEKRSETQIDSLTEFIAKAKLIHGDKYDYSQAAYRGSKTKVKIVCPLHGAFYQRPNDHLNGKACPVCGGRSKSVEQFVDEAKVIHGDKYDYSKVNKGYGNDKVEIRCLKCGQIFHQKPWSHLQGHGCPYCIKSRLEEEIETFLHEQNIAFVREQKFDWLGRMSLDFFLPHYNVAIECQGAQHFKGSRCFGHEEMEEVIIERDKRKFELCQEHNIVILYYTNLHVTEDYFGFITKEKEELLSHLLEI